MQTDNRFIDDLAKLANSAVGTLSGVGREIETLIRQRVEKHLGGLDMVKRDEFEAIKAMAAAAREENAALLARIAALEAKIAAE